MKSGPIAAFVLAFILQLPLQLPVSAQSECGNIKVDAGESGLYFECDRIIF